MFCSASSGPPAAISPSSGSRATSARLDGCRSDLAALAADQLERARLRRVAPQQPGPLEVREVRVHGRRRGEADLLADLAHGRRVAVAVDVLDEVVPDLLLAGGEHGRLLGVSCDEDERVFAIRVETPADGVNGRRTKSRPTRERLSMRWRGLEPPRPQGHKALNLARLPIPPPARESGAVYRATSVDRRELALERRPLRLEPRRQRESLRRASRPARRRGSRGRRSRSRSASRRACGSRPSGSTCGPAPASGGRPSSVSRSQPGAAPRRRRRATRCGGSSRDRSAPLLDRRGEAQRRVGANSPA